MDIIVTIFKFYLLYIFIIHKVIEILELIFIFLSKQTIFNENISYVKRQK